MTSRLVIDNDNKLKEIVESESFVKSPVIRVIANILSYVFHPLFIPVYIIWYLNVAHPTFFAGFPKMLKMITIVRFFLIYSFFPLVTVLLAKGLGFLDSILLKTQKERIIPYIACQIYFFFNAYVLRHQPEFPQEIIHLSIAIFFGATLGLIGNIFMKVSMHAISMGILVSFAGLLAFTQAASFNLLFSSAILIAGLVCTARLVLSTHNQREIYFGLLIGLISMMLGVWTDAILP